MSELPANALSMSTFFSWKVRTSVKIVKARITGQTPIIISENGADYTCGYYLDVEVIESYRGGSEPFKVFTNHKDTFMGSEYEYLIFAEENRWFVPRCREKHGSHFEWRDAHYSTYGNDQLIFPIYRNSKENFGEEYVMMRPISDFPLGYTGTVEYRLGRNNYERSSADLPENSFDMLSLKALTSEEFLSDEYAWGMKELDCPLGICMGTSPKDIEGYKHTSVNEKYSLKVIRISILNSRYLQFSVGLKGTYDVDVFFSNEHGVCALRANIEVPPSNKDKLKEQLLLSITEELGVTQQDKSNETETYNWQITDQSRYKNLTHVQLDFSNKAEPHDRELKAQVQYRYENFEACLEEQPLIANEFE